MRVVDENIMEHELETELKPKPYSKAPQGSSRLLGGSGGPSKFVDSGDS